MARANRYYIPGRTWHITHRCHNRKFLLKFNKDKLIYQYWLREAKRRFGFSLLNYTITSNHTHLLAWDTGEPGAIAASMQLIAGETALAYNKRKGRSGAFWEDRYHATAVQNGTHLRRCMTYIDMNMVRAGVVKSPDEWVFGGYHRYQNPLKLEYLLDVEAAVKCLGFPSLKELQIWQCEAAKTAIEKPLLYDPKWTQAIAVGDDSFLNSISEDMHLPKHKHAIQDDMICESPGDYSFSPF